MIEPYTTTHDSIPAETGKNDDDGTSGDCISRQQAIEVLRNRWLKTRNYDGIGEDIAEECEIYLKTLPSVQPETNCSEISNSSDVISRQAVIRWVKQECNPYGKPTLDFESGKRVMEHLEMMPSAQPERKAVFNRDIAIEAICDEVMLWFDVSATKAYEIAETAVKRIEVRMEKMEKGEQE